MIFLWLLAGIGAIDPKGAEDYAMARPEIRPARDGNIAIRQELEAARRAGTIAAYDLFIARHPRHPLAELARRERAVLVRQTPQG